MDENANDGAVKPDIKQQNAQLVEAYKKTGKMAAAVPRKDGSVVAVPCPTTEYGAIMLVRQLKNSGVVLDETNPLQTSPGQCAANYSAARSKKSK